MTADIPSDIERLDEWSNGVLDAIEAGSFEEAERLCEKLLKHYPDVIDGYERLAALREAEGRFADAVAAYDRALAFIEREPDGFDREMVDFLRESRDNARQHAANPAG